jgi:hypothetical protein
VIKIVTTWVFQYAPMKKKGETVALNPHKHAQDVRAAARTPQQPPPLHSSHRAAGCICSLSKWKLIVSLLTSFDATSNHASVLPMRRRSCLQIMRLNPSKPSHDVRASRWQPPTYQEPKEEIM